MASATPWHGSNQVAGPAGLKAGSKVVLMETMFTSAEVEDEVLASITYEPDIFW